MLTIWNWNVVLTEHIPHEIVSKRNLAAFTEAATERFMLPINTSVYDTDLLEVSSGRFRRGPRERCASTVLACKFSLSPRSIQSFPNLAKRGRCQVMNVDDVP